MVNQSVASLRLAWRALCVFTVLLALRPGARAASETFLPFQWGWSYVDYGFTPSANWYSTNYEEVNWKYNYGIFGFGYGDEQTLVSYGPNPASKFVTTYFRTWVWVSNPAQYATATFTLRRDDGAVVYLNGVELYRSNMPGGTVDYGTLALSEISAVDDAVDVAVFPSSVFVPGPNLLAVEIHQSSAASSDLRFDLQVVAATDGTPLISRGPYLQLGTSSNIVVRWRTDVPADSRVRFGTAADSLDRMVSDGILTTEHEMLLPGLAPYTRYYYQVGTSAAPLAGDASHTFITAPEPGTVQPVRIWAIGDFGTGFEAQHKVRSAYTSFTGTRATDVWLMLGDNAYFLGLDHEYQANLFNIYPELLRQNVSWPTVGNHDTAGSQELSDDFPYYRIFTLPTAGQAGGVPSGTEHYYSFDYANIHFICLDSMTAVLRQPNSAMANWLRADLAETTRDWIIAYWHHPAYTKGTHNSDTEGELIQMREVFLPILEEAGVDLVLWGHSHNYERSFFLDGFYGFSSSINPTNFVSSGSGKTNETGAYLKPAGGMGTRRGAVYITDGSSGGQGTGGTIDHPAMYYSSYENGSVVIDIVGQRLDAAFIREDGEIRDHFTIDKGNLQFNVTNAPPSPSISRGNEESAIISWRTSLPDFRLESKRQLLSSESWQSTPGIIITNGRVKSVVVPSGGSNEFFRLRSVP